MKKYIQFLYVIFLLLTSLSAQQFYTPLEVGTAGATVDRECRTYAVSYNVLRFMSGMAGLVYSN